MKRAICCTKAKINGNEKKSSGASNGIGLVQICSGKKWDPLKCGTILLYSVHAVLPILGIMFPQKLVYNEHTFCISYM